MILTTLLCTALLLILHVLPTASKRSDDYTMLALSIRDRLNELQDVKTITSALKSLSKTQEALKKIDGSAHEIYQRTHKTSTTLEEDDDEDVGGNKVGGLKVKGRMSRNAARVGCVADALFAAELCELVADPSSDDDDDGTLASWMERKIVFNSTIQSEEPTGNIVALSVLIIYEPKYSGGAGVKHGGIEDLLSVAQEEVEDETGSDGEAKSTSSPERGRFIIILSDNDAISAKNDLPFIISTLDTPPTSIKLSRQSKEAARVNDPLYRLAGTLIRSIGQVIDSIDKDDTEVDKDVSSDDNSETEPTKDKHMSPSEQPAIHIVGHSLSGAVAALAATILDGSLPMPPDRNQKSQKRWSGFARDRVSALCLGCPPCIAGIDVDFVTSIINGDDIVCRCSHSTLQRLYARTERSIKGGVLGKGVGWMSDAARLTVTGLTSGSTKKKENLEVPGRVYLIRPRRIGGGVSSIHEVGGSIGGRENFRAAVLWQLNDVLLSKSLWKHHSQSSYIRSLDRVQLKGFADA